MYKCQHLMLQWDAVLLSRALIPYSSPVVGIQVLVAHCVRCIHSQHTTLDHCGSFLKFRDYDFTFLP